jgi:uncharacterized protein (TIGR02596 family)
MTILVILMATAGPALNSVMDGGRVTQAATTTINQLTLGRLKAIAENRTIGVRFIRTNSTASYDRIQLVSIDSSGRATGAEKVALLPDGAAIAKSGLLSSILNTNEVSAVSGTDPSIPNLGTAYRYIQFTFRPRGNTDRDITQKWFVTVLLQRNDNSDTPPKNFVTIQVDPVNGGLQIYRP